VAYLVAAALSYKKGRRLEYRVRDYLRRNGWAVFRCAASKPVDLIALKDGAKPMLIECKYGSSHPTKKEKADLVELALKAGAYPIIAHAEKYGKINFEYILQKSYKQENKSNTYAGPVREEA
jgi:Holliday junction resolvase